MFQGSVTRRGCKRGLFHTFTLVALGTSQYPSPLSKAYSPLLKGKIVTLSSRLGLDSRVSNLVISRGSRRVRALILSAVIVTTSDSSSCSFNSRARNSSSHAFDVELGKRLINSRSSSLVKPRLLFEPTTNPSYPARSSQKIAAVNSPAPIQPSCLPAHSPD